MHRWVSAGTTLLLCVSNGATSLLHQPIGIIVILYAKYSTIWMKHTHSYAHNLYIDLCHGHYKTLHTIILDSLKMNKSSEFLQPTVKFIFVMETNIICFYIIPSQFVLMCLVVKESILIFVMAWCHSGAKPSFNPPSAYFAHEYVLLHGPHERFSVQF